MPELLDAAAKLEQAGAIPFQPELLSWEPPPFFRFLPWFRHLSDYPLRAILFVLILLDTYFLLVISGNQKLPGLFIASAILGFVVAMSSFVDDGTKLSRILSFVTTSLVCSLAIVLAAMPLLLLTAFYCGGMADLGFFGNKIGLNGWLSLAWGPLKALGILLSVSATVAFLFWRFGFFRPAAISFLIFSLTAPMTQDIFLDTDKFYDLLARSESSSHFAYETDCNAVHTGAKMS